MLIIFENVINPIINGTIEDAIEFYNVLKKTILCKICGIAMKDVQKKPISDKYVFKCYNSYCEKKDSTLSIRTNTKTKIKGIQKNILQSYLIEFMWRVGVLKNDFNNLIILLNN